MYKSLLGTFLLVSLGMIQILAQGEEEAQEEATAQEEEVAPDEKTTVTLASPHVLPGERAYLTLLLANSPDVAVAQLDHWIEFPKGMLAYVSSRLGIAADLAKAVLDLEFQDKPASETAQEGTVLMHLSIKSERPIPDGPLVEVSFNVANVQPQTIVFAHRLEALNTEGDQISGIVSSDGQLEVTHLLPDAPPGIFSCFFYMH
jgi:hypothetical protein